MNLRLHIHPCRKATERRMARNIEKELRVQGMQAVDLPVVHRKLVQLLPALQPRHADTLRVVLHKNAFSVPECNVWHHGELLLTIGSEYAYTTTEGTL